METIKVNKLFNFLTITAVGGGVEIGFSVHGTDVLVKQDGGSTIVTMNGVTHSDYKLFRSIALTKFIECGFTHTKNTLMIKDGLNTVKIQYEDVLFKGASLVSVNEKVAVFNSELTAERIGKINSFINNNFK